MHKDMALDATLRALLPVVLEVVDADEIAADRPLQGAWLGISDYPGRALAFPRPTKGDRFGHARWAALAMTLWLTDDPGARWGTGADEHLGHALGQVRLPGRGALVWVRPL